MKPKTMILMVVAVGCGLGASYMTSKLLAERNKAPVETPMVPVLVAKERIPAWQPIKEPERLFEIKQYPQDVAPPKAVGSFEELKDQQLNKPLDAGKPLTVQDLLTKEQKEVALQIQPGQRAVAFKVNVEAMVAGYVLPGSRVDVSVITRGADASARIFLQNMLVLAVDQTDQAVKAGEVRTIVGQTVTLAATPEESLRLALAGSQGELRLLLRRPGEDAAVSNVVVKMGDLERPAKSAKVKDTETAGEPASGSTLPDLPKLDEEKKDEAPPKPAKRAEEEPKKASEPVKEKPASRRTVKVKRSHKMTVRNGADERKVRIDLGKEEGDEEEEVVVDDNSGKREGKPKEEKKAEPNKPGTPAPTPTPAPTSPFGKSTRTRGARSGT
jgi:pilus assembly protein CpaB